MSLPRRVSFEWEQRIASDFQLLVFVYTFYAHASGSKIRGARTGDSRLQQTAHRDVKWSARL